MTKKPMQDYTRQGGCGGMVSAILLTSAAIVFFIWWELFFT